MTTTTSNEVRQKPPVDTKDRSIFSFTKDFLHMLRVHQWIKNSFIFIAPFFAGIIIDSWQRIMIGFFAFSFISSSIYVLNDIMDAKEDRLHPIKKGRPIAAGKISIPLAILTASIMFLSGLIISWVVDPAFFYALAIYLILNILYSGGLKKQPLIDIFIIASGFILRTVSGGIIADVNISQWLLIMIFLLALFLAFGKRRDDLHMSEKMGIKLRKSLKGYNMTFLNATLAILAAIIIVAYMMYSISDEVQIRMKSDKVYFTNIFVVAGMLRYLQIILVEEKAFSPVKILYYDRFILFTIIGCIATFIGFIYI